MEKPRPTSMRSRDSLRYQSGTVALVWWAVVVVVVLVGTASAVGTAAPSSSAVSTAAAPATQQASAGDRCAQCEAFLRHAYVLPTLLD
jgi:hypothetical protein